MLTYPHSLQTLTRSRSASDDQILSDGDSPTDSSLQSQHSCRPGVEMATALIVDDDDQQRAFVAKSLYLTGCQILEAASIDEALTIVRTEKPDLIVMDLFLPKPRGLMFMREMQLMFESIKIVAVIDECCSTDSKCQQLALNCGAYATIAKPIKQIELISLILDLIGRG
jgi:CheY-like chemotaxis protein